MKNAIVIKVEVLEASIEMIVAHEKTTNEFPVEIDGREFAPRTVMFVRMEAALDPSDGIYKGTAFFQAGKYPQNVTSDFKELLELLNIVIKPKPSPVQE